MKGKITLLVGGAVGYVLGTRAGRERYEQIQAQARKVLQNPTVRQKAAQAQDFAKEKAPEMQQRFSDAAATAGAAAKDKMGGEHPATSTYPNAASAQDLLRG